MQTELAALSHRLRSISGLSGALLFFAGDMLFYGHLGSGGNFHAGMLNTVTHASLLRLFAGGLVGPVAACLCIVGFWHVSQNIHPSNGFSARLTFVLFSVLMVFGSAIHTLWTTKGLALKYCYGNDDAGCRALAHAVDSYWDLAYNIGSIPGFVGAVVLFALVLLRKTNYPRWTVLANPAVLILLSPLTNRIPAPLGAIISGGSTNLSIALFFLISLITTRRPRQAAA